jgi:hypothetical protein
MFQSDNKDLGACPLWSDSCVGWTWCNTSRFMREGWHKFGQLTRTCKIELTKGVSHCGLAIYIKEYLNAKEELWKRKYFTIQKSSKRNQNPSKILL